MDGAADAALGAWASIRGFFTPATLFLVVNLVIGTIALTSRSHQRRRRGNGYSPHDADAQHHQEQQPFHHAQHQEDQYFDDHDQQQQHHEQQYVPPPPALARTSSVLDRLRSIGLYRFRSGDFPPEYAATDSRDVTVSSVPAGGDAHNDRSRSEPAPIREARRKSAPSRMKKSSSSDAWKAEVAPAPAARVVREAVLEEEDDYVEEQYARADEFTEDNSFTTPQHEEEQYYREEYVPPPRPAPLARTSSVLDRLRSIGLSRFRSGDFPPEYAVAPATDSRDVTVSSVPAGGDAHNKRSRSEEPAPIREARRKSAPSRMKKSSSSDAWKAEVAPAPEARVVREAVLEEENDYVEEQYARADEFTENNSFTTPQQPLPPAPQHEEEQYYREEYVPPPRPPPLARAPSVLERLRSFGLSRFRSGDFAADDAAAAVAELERNQTQKQATQYSRSRSEPSREQSKKGQKQQQGTEPKMSKSSSEARKPAPEEPEAEEGGVDARADNFINSFRKQLQLQRLNSLLNYKEMLNRGA